MEKVPARLPRPRELSQLAISYEHVENFTKDLEVRRDLGHRASPVNRAHMKRPTLSFSTSKDDYVYVLCIDPAKEKLTLHGTKNSESTENRQASIR